MQGKITFSVVILPSQILKGLRKRTWFFLAWRLQDSHAQMATWDCTEENPLLPVFVSGNCVGIEVVRAWDLLFSAAFQVMTRCHSKSCTFSSLIFADRGGGRIGGVPGKELCLWASLYVYSVRSKSSSQNECYLPLVLQFTFIKS